MSNLINTELEIQLDETNDSDNFDEKMHSNLLRRNKPMERYVDIQKN